MLYICYKNANIHKNANVQTNSLSGLPVVCTKVKQALISISTMCGSRKYPYPPHGGSRKFRGVGGSENDKFPKGRGVTPTVFFPGGLK